MKILYRALFLVLIFLPELSNGQTNTSSPYSVYGVGDINPEGLAKNRALGGTGIALPTEMTLNNMNPASYYTIDSLSFITDFSLDYKRSKFVYGNYKPVAQNVGLGNLAFGFRNTNWWKNSIGIIPFSSVGNTLTYQRGIDGSSDILNVNVQGTGGLNKVYWGNAFKILPNLAVGINVSYIFGSITQTNTITSKSGLFDGSLVYTDNMYLGKLYVNYGAQYAFKVNNKIKGGLGVIYGSSCKLNLNHELTTYDNSGVKLQDNVTSESSFTLPGYFGAGFYLKLDDKLLLAGDYKFSNWAKSKPLENTIRFANTNNFNLGLEYTPSVSFRDHGLKKLNYRIGGYVNPSYMVISGQQINDRGFTAGLGIPLMQKKIFFNLAYQYGKKGVDSGSGIINEYYQRFNISITFFDFWFVKPKFD
jgi:Outer membrane protein transport protein (OMPP1/FadL/TodX).